MGSTAGRLGEDAGVFPMPSQFLNPQVNLTSVWLHRMETLKLLYREHSFRSLNKPSQAPQKSFPSVPGFLSVATVLPAACTF